MRPAPPQRELFVRPAPSSDTVVVNDRVCFQTEEKQRVVFVHGVIFSHYAIEDRTAEAYAMVLLFGSIASPLSGAPQDWWTERARAPGRAALRQLCQA